jgi:glyoxylase-like metal-dependent hydrolase (beta-lactamase superfamily II)
VLIDPGMDRDAIESALDAASLVPAAIIVTHGHFDHIGSAEHFRSRYDIPVYLHSADESIARTSNFRLLAMKIQARVTMPSELSDIHDASVTSLLDGIRVVDAPGHTPGSVVIFVQGAAFTGDTIYRTGVWPMDWPEQDTDGLVATLHNLWDAIPDGTVIYPGHGRSATFASIKSGNAELRRLIGLTEAQRP